MNQLKPVILCVDDEEANLKLLEKLLVPRGYVVVSTASGKDALLKIKSQAVDLVLLDILMPGMDGFEVCRQIKEDQKLRSIPVIMVTALSAKQDRIRGIEAGAEEFLSKPFDQTEVLARIKILLKMKKLDDERKRAESQKEAALAALQKSHDELDRRVQKRTAELAKANEILQADITESKRAEEEHKAHIRFLESLGRIDQAIKQETDVEQMLRHILQTVFSIFDCDRAWLFYPCDPDAPTFRVPMIICRPEYPAAEVLDVDLPMPPDMAQNLREALASDEPVIYIAGTEKPINKVTAKQFGVQSQMFVALYPKLGKPWVFGMHQCSYPRIWTEEEKILFKEISCRISDGLNSVLYLRELQENKAKLSKAQRLAKIGSWEWDAIADTITWSEEYYRIYGFDPTQHPPGYEEHLKAYTPESAVRLDAAVKRNMQTGEPYDVDLELANPKGPCRWITARSETMHDAQGKIIGLRGTAQDITERKRAEYVLRISEGRYRIAEAIGHVGTWEYNLQTTKFWGSDEAKRIYGFDPEALDFSTDEVENCIPERERVHQALVDLIERDKPYNLEFEIHPKNSLKSRIISSVAELKRDEHGNPLRVRGVIQDITERKQYEESLHNASLYTRSLIEASLDPLVTINQEGKITDVNKATEIITGISRGQLVDSDFTDCFTEPEKARAGYQQVLSEGLVRDYPLTIRHTSGNMIDVLYNATLYKNEEGQVQGIFAAAHDITKRKQAEVEIAGVNRALRMLSDTNEALIHIMDEVALLNEVCRIVVEVGSYHMAWVGFVEHDEKKTLHPVAHAGFDSGYIESANITWADNERGCGPGGIAIRTGQPCMARDIIFDPAFAPWREAAIERGYKSLIALPLISNGQILGVLGIYSVDTDAFNTKEVEILKELADDLAFGITTLRIRDKNKQVENTLRESEEQYRLITENTADTIAIFDLNLNPTYISPAMLKLRGYTVQEAMTQTLNQMLTPDSLQLASKNFADQMALESSGTADPARTTLMELEEYCKDGSTIWVELAVSFLRDNNFKPTGILTVTRNITERRLVEEKLEQTMSSLKKAVGATIQVLVSAVESRDPYTAGHQFRSANLACAIAAEMGLAQEKIDGIQMAASIHDIGKLSIPTEILTKPTKLTKVEFSLIQEHSRTGYEMVKDVESPWPLAQIVYQHHERMNGTGYPRNLKGDEILMEARIMAVADVVEAIASHRPYRPALGIDFALEEIEKNKGTFYDNAVADACLRLFREKGYQLLAQKIAGASFIHCTWIREAQEGS